MSRLNIMARLPVRLAMGILAGLAFGVLIVFSLPGISEWLGRAALAERGFTVEELAVSSVGLTTAQVGNGSIRQGGLRVRWERMTFHYTPLGLVSGGVSTLYLLDPLVELDVASLGRGDPLEGAGAGAPAEAEAQPAEESLAAGGEGADPPVPVPGVSPVSGESGPPALAGPLLEAINAIPLREMTADAGRFRLALSDEQALDFGWTLLADNPPESLQADLAVQGDFLDVDGSLKARKPDGPVSLLALFTLRPESTLATLAGLLPEAVRDLEVRAGEPLTGEALVELDRQGALRMSAEASVAGLGIRSGSDAPWGSLEEALLMGSYAEGKVHLESAFRFAPLQWGDFASEPWSARVAVNSGEGIQLETEPIEFSWASWSGSLAMRGGADMPMPGVVPEPRMEISVMEFGDPSLFRLEPFSLLYEEHEEAHVLTASPAGIKRGTTVWVEEFEARYQLADSDGSAAFVWYNGLGAQMGGVDLAFRGIGTEESRVDLRLSGPEGAAFFEASYLQGEEKGDLQAGGTLSIEWLNALAAWWGDLPVRLGGPGPRLELALDHGPARLKGDVHFVLDGLEARLDSGTVFEGIRGDWDFRVDFFPKSDGWQRLAIDRIRSGEVELTDFTLSFSLPTVARLQVREVSGHLGGGQVTADPFFFDPAKPDIETRLRFRSISGSALLEWMEEDRFGIEGTVSGTVRLRWQDGMLSLGEAELRLDQEQGQSRFIFADRSFLEEYFGGLGGIPAEIRDRVLQALLREGVLIDDLEARLVPVADSEKVSLRVTLSGRTRTEDLEVPIEQLVINNLISRKDLGRLLGMVGPVRFLDE